MSISYVTVTGKGAVLGWVQPASVSMVLDWERRGVVISHVVYFDEDHSVTEGHRIVFGTRNLETRGSADASAGLSVVFGVVCEEITRRTA